MARFSSNVRFEVDLTDNHNSGNWTPQVIVMHWWDDPAKRPTFGGVVSWFNTPSAQVSAHYVVEGGRITQMVYEKDRAWHAGNDWANKHGIGIEVNPRLSAADYRTTAELIAEIRGRLGPLPLQPHHRYTTTGCPGSMDLSRLNREARGKPSSSSSSSSGSSGSSSSSGGRKSTGTLAQEVIDGKHGSGDARKRSLGSRYNEVQREVNRRLLGSSNSSSSSSGRKSTGTLAQEVIDGKHGSGDARKRSLGSRYNEVQREVNRRLLGSSGGGGGRKSTAQLAQEVIDGKHGNGDARKRSLGSRYNEVQREVNRRL